MMLFGLLTACEPDPHDTGARDTGSTGVVDSTDSNTDTHTGDSTDTHDTAETGHTGDTGDSGDTGDNPLATEGIEEVAVDAETFADVGYEVVTYEVTAEAPDPYESLNPGARPTFYVWRPVNVTEDEQLPAILFHHGGGIGDDSVETPHQCEAGVVQGWVENHLNGSLFLGWVAAERRWTIVLPRNDWCDAFQGLGPDDPVDPEHHFGHVHEERALAFVEAGGAGFHVKRDQEYLWGTSAGAGSAVASAVNLGRISGVVWDSGFANFFLYYDLPGSDGLPATAELEHIFGGPPFVEDGSPNGAVYDRYANASATTLIESGLSPRVFGIWNTQDQELDPLHGQAMDEALSGFKPIEDGGSLDMDHPFPGDDYHVQSVFRQQPNGYYTWALAEFLEGSDMAVTEAEDGCTQTSCIGAVMTVLDGAEYSSNSRGSLRAGALGEAGVLAEAKAPPDVVQGAATRVTFAFSQSSAAVVGLAAEVAAIVVYDGDTEISRRVITGANMAPPGISTSDVSLLIQYSTNWVGFRAPNPAHLRAEFETTGVAALDVDSAIWLVDPP